MMSNQFLEIIASRRLYNRIRAREVRTVTLGWAYGLAVVAGKGSCGNTGKGG